MTPDHLLYGERRGLVATGEQQVDVGDVGGGPPPPNPQPGTADPPPAAKKQKKKLPKTNMLFPPVPSLSAADTRGVAESGDEPHTPTPTTTSLVSFADPVESSRT